MSPALFSPLRLGNKVARNRLFVPPMCQYTLENRDGVANYETAQHYGALARGGWMTGTTGEIGPEKFTWND